MVDAKALLLKLTGAVRELARHSTPAPHILQALDEIDAELVAIPDAPTGPVETQLAPTGPGTPDETAPAEGDQGDDEGASE